MIIDNAIDVFYEDPKPHVQTLRWVIRISPPVIMVPETITWQLADRGETKVITIAQAGRDTIVVSKTDFNSDSFAWQLIAKAPGEVYEIHVRPRLSDNVRSTARILVGPPGVESWRSVELIVR